MASSDKELRRQARAVANSEQERADQEFADSISAFSEEPRKDQRMPIQGEYEASPRDWVREQVEAYEASGGQKANTLRETGLPVIIVTMKGNKSGKVRKIALMRVEQGGE